MTTLDAHELDAVTGGTLDAAPALPVGPRPELAVPKLPSMPGTIPLGPFTPPAPSDRIA